MNLKRLLAAALFAVAAIPAAFASQATHVQPTTGPMSLGTFVTSWLNPALAAIQSCNSGSSAPAVTSQPLTFEFWCDSSSAPKVLKIYDGASWLSIAQIDASGHTLTLTGIAAKFSGTSSGTVTVQVQAAAGTYNFNLPTAAGTSGQPLLSGGGGSTAMTFGTLQPAAGGTGITSLGTGIATWWGTPSSANLAAAITDETGTGAAVFANTPTLVTPVLGAATGTSLNLSGLTASSAVATDASKNLVSVTNTGTGNNVLATSPTLTTPNLGTPSALTLTNATGLPIGGITGLGTGVGTWLATPSSANLAAAITDETGSGAAVFATSPTLVTPTLGVASATSVNKLTITAPATGSTLTVLDGKTLTANKTLTLDGTDGTTMTFPSTSATIARTDAANTFTGHQTVEGVTSTGATGTGKFVFDTSPTLVTPNLGTPSALTLTNATGLPIGGITGLGTGVGTWLATPSSANLAAAITDETGTGASVFGTAPTLGGLVNISGAVKLSTESAPAQITANQNDYNPGSVICATSSTLLLNSDAARDVTGFAAGTAGCILRVINTGAFAITFKDESVSSTAANRFGLGADLALASKAGATFNYDGTNSRWRLVGGPPGAGGGGGSGTVTQVNSGTGLTGGPITTSGTLSLTAANTGAISAFTQSNLGGI